MRASVPLTVASRPHAALARSQDLALADVLAEYEAAMQSFPVRRRGIFLHRITASLFLSQVDALTLTL